MGNTDSLVDPTVGSGLRSQNERGFEFCRRKHTTTLKQQLLHHRCIDSEQQGAEVCLRDLEFQADPLTAPRS